MATLYYYVDTTRFRTDKATREAPAVIRLAFWLDSDAEPECWLVNPAAADVTLDPAAYRYHGVSLIEACGPGSISPTLAAQRFSDAVLHADELVAFSADFHERNVNRMADGQPLAAATLCAMKAAMPLVQKPRMAPGGGYAFPSLDEACRHFGILPPLAVTDDGGDDPIARGKSIVTAVREVWEAIATFHAGVAASEAAQLT
jgi:hypothetical protein